MDVCGQKWLNSGKAVVFGQVSLYSGTSGCIRAKWFYLGKVAVFGQTLLYSGKSGCIFAKVLVFGVFLPKCLYSVKFVLFG